MNENISNSEDVIDHNEVFQKYGKTVITDWSKFPGIPNAFDFEANFSRDYHRRWMYDNWHIAIYVSVIYVMIIFLGRSLMANREAFCLRTPMALWNFSLAIFSLAGTIRCLPEFVHILASEGLQPSYCSSSYYRDVRVTIWYWLFVWSKVIELGDTVFIILRKQKLIFLHWIHHVLTLSYAFFVIGDAPGTARWMVSMNFAIHTAMYSYYALKALQVRIPRSIAMVITISQIVQMIFGLYINYKAYALRLSGQTCDTSFSASLCGLLIYFLFFLLFIKFFVFAYCSKFTLKGVRRVLKVTAKDVAKKVD